MLRRMHAANPPPIGAHGQLGPQRVLVVDDNPDATELLSLLLQRAGHQTLVVGSARDALAAASEFRPQVALIDIGLPDMDGYKLTNLLRAQPALEHCRFIAVTGHKSAGAVARSIAAGFEAHLSKPISTSEILSVVAGSRQ